MKKVIVLKTAEQDLVNGWHFYEDQEAGVGAQFYEVVMASLRELSWEHDIHPSKGRFQRSLIMKFHTGIYYSIEAEAVIVHRILDLRRNPRWLRRQLRDDSSIPRSSS